MPKSERHADEILHMVGLTEQAISTHGGYPAECAKALGWQGNGSSTTNSGAG